MSTGAAKGDGKAGGRGVATFSGACAQAAPRAQPEALSGNPARVELRW